MKIAVMGAGAIGGYFGARLATVATNDVTLIARGAHLAAMQEKGLHVRSPLGDFTVNPVQATNNPAEVGPVNQVQSVRGPGRSVRALAAGRIVGPDG